MPLYRYSGNSIIDEVRFLSNENGGIRAYLHASKQAKPEELERTLSDLAKLGYIAVPCRLNGQDVLEVRGFKKESNLRTALGEAGAVTGHPLRDELGDDKLDAWAWFKQKSLMISSVLYLVGDFCFIQYEKVNTKIKETKKKEKAELLNEAVEKYNEGKVRADKLPEYSDEDTRSPFAKSKVWDWLAGYGYLAGSSSSLLSMLLRGDTSQTELGSISRYITDAARDAGLGVEENQPLQSSGLLRDTRSKFAKGFTTYSAEMMNLSFATAGVAIAKDSYETHARLSNEEKIYGAAYDFSKDKRHNDDKSVGVKDTILGLGTLFSGVTSSVIKEKPLDPNKPRKKGFAGLIEYLKERPLRIAGAGYLISTVIHLWSSLQERSSIHEDNKTSNRKEPFPDGHTTFRLGFVIMNLIAEVIMYFSSKGHGEGLKSDESLDLTATAMVAQMIAKKPKEQQAALVDTMADALSKPQALGIKVDKAKQLLREQLENLESNPWMKAVDTQKPAVAVANDLGEPAVVKTTEVPAPKEIAGPRSDTEQMPQEAPQPAAASDQPSYSVAPREKTVPVPTSLIDRAVVADTANQVLAFN